MLLSQAIEVYVKSTSFSKEAGTVQSYRQSLSHFCVFLRNPKLTSITEDQVVEYFSLLKELAMWKENSLLILGTSMSRFFDFWRMRGYPVLDPRMVPKFKREYSKPQPAQEEDIAKLLEVCDRNDPYDLRNIAIIKLLKDTGMRCGEMCTMDTDIDTKKFTMVQTDPEDRKSPKVKQYSHIIKSKKSRGRQPFRKVFWYSDTNEALKKWIEARKDLKSIKDKDALFVGVKTWRMGHRMDSYNVSLVFRRLCKRAGIKRLHPHMLRHMFGNTLGAGGANNSVISDLMGHASLNSSFVYTHLNDKQASQTHMKYIKKRGKVA